MFYFKPKKPEEEKKPEINQANIDLEIITKMNQEFAVSLELNDTLDTALKVIIERLNAQAANIFLINDQKKKFEIFLQVQDKYRQIYFYIRFLMLPEIAYRLEEWLYFFLAKFLGFYLNFVLLKRV